VGEDFGKLLRKITDIVYEYPGINRTVLHNSCSCPEDTLDKVLCRLQEVREIKNAGEPGLPKYFGINHIKQLKYFWKGFIKE
jgi:hypothetical protein